MTVEAYLWFEIVKNILIIGLILLFVSSAVFSIIADIEKRKAYKELRKGFHVEFVNMETDADQIDKVADEITKRLKGLK